ncbi:MAG: Nif3-like dinuclear metal center hexameric protein [Bacteroidetes bacterium]|nr:Nif3-like dinuclear metal center hexameric protein [Bacteroidota bacterium]
MHLQSIIDALEKWAPLAYQESYDNCGLLIGDRSQICTGILCCLDVTEAVVQDAIAKKCNLIVAHHPLIFKGLKKLTGSNATERTLVAAIKSEIAIYAIHTNLDNIREGVNHALAQRLGLQKTRVLLPKKGLLSKLSTFVPTTHYEKVLSALFKAGAGHIGNYSECSFRVTGTGTFLPQEGTNPFSGTIGMRSNEEEYKIEVILPTNSTEAVVKALLASHPYEEVAYDLMELSNEYGDVGSGMVGYLPEPMEVGAFFDLIREKTGIPCIRHSAWTGKKIEKIALCGGAGSFLIGEAKRSGADIFLTADLKYHDFFEADGKIILGDIGHLESEQFTIQLLNEFLSKKFPTFAVLNSEVQTNPVRYWI